MRAARERFRAVAAVGTTRARVKTACAWPEMTGAPMGLACGCDCCALRASEIARRASGCQRRVAGIRLRAKTFDRKPSEIGWRPGGVQRRAELRGRGVASAEGTAVWGMAREGLGGACEARRRAVTVFATRTERMGGVRWRQGSARGARSGARASDGLFQASQCNASQHHGRRNALHIECLHRNCRVFTQFQANTACHGNLV